MKKIISGIITSALLAGTLSVGTAAADAPLLIAPNPTVTPVTPDPAPVEQTGPVAMIGDNEYDTLSDAVSDVEDGDSIIVLRTPAEDDIAVVDRCVSFTVEYDRTTVTVYDMITAGGDVNLSLRGMSYDDGTNLESYTFYDCELFFDMNGGTSLSGEPRTDGAISGKQYRLPGKFLYTAPEGCVFRAWEIDGVEYAAQDWYEFTGDTTITAIWEDAIEAAAKTAFRDLVHAMPDWENDIEEVKNEMRQAYAKLIALRQAEQ